MVGPAAFPVAKLGFLLIKQVSKPLAKSVAARAKSSPIFKNWVCIPVAQFFHFYEVKIKLRALNLGTGKVTKVPKLTEAKAVEQGAEILSELIIVGIASAILIYEYDRSKDKEDAKEEKLKADRESIKNKIFELELKVEKQSTQIRSLAKTAIHLEEEFHKKSLKGLLGKTANVPQELIKTVEEIPEVPQDVKPLVLVSDTIEEANDDKPVPNTENKSSKSVSEESQPTIQEIIQQHYSKPVLIENKVVEPTVNVSDNLEDHVAQSNTQEKSGLVTDSVTYVLQK